MKPGRMLYGSAGASGGRARAQVEGRLGRGCHLPGPLDRKLTLHLWVSGVHHSWLLDSQLLTLSSGEPDCFRSAREALRKPIAMFER